MKDLFALIIGLLIIIGIPCLIILAPIIWWESYSCHARWQEHTKWGVASGCLVEIQPGKLIPEKNYRQF